MVKFWMDRDQIVGPIDAYLQERSDRISEIDEAKDREKRAKDEYFKVMHLERPYIHSHNHLLRNGGIVSTDEVIKLKELVLNACDGKVLCDQSTVTFLDRLTSAVDDEISMHNSRAKGWEGYAKFLKDMASHVTAPPPERVIEIEKSEEPGLGWSAIVVGIAFLPAYLVLIMKAIGW